MNIRPCSALLASLVLATPLLGGCSHLGRLAFWRKAPAPVEAAQELVATDAAGGVAPKLPQTWQRNAVRVDVTALSGQGGLTLRPLAGHDWPVRLEFLARPGSFARLQLQGDQRVLIAVPADGDAVVLEVPVGVYSAGTRALQVGWGN